MVDGETDQVEKKRGRNPLAFLFRNRPLFPCGGGGNGNSCKSEAFMIKGIFGQPLECAAQCGTLTPYGLSIPVPVNRCFTEILARGLRVEGLFRLSGAATEVEALRQQFDQPPTYGKYLDLAKNDIHAITSLVKKYLRYLPDPVIPVAYHDLFLRLQVNWKQGDRALVTEYAKVIKSSFPTTHYHVMHYIILVVAWIQHYQHLNLMNPEALAVVLAPICSGFENSIYFSKSGFHDNRGIRSSQSIVTTCHKQQQQQQQQQSFENVDQVIATNLRWTSVWILLIQHHDILLDHWRPTNLTGYHKPHYAITKAPWTQSTITVPDEDLLMGMDDTDDNDNDNDVDSDAETDDCGVEKNQKLQTRSTSIEAPPQDDRYGVIVMRKQQGCRRRYMPGVAKDDEHIYLYDTPLPPLPIPEYLPQQHVGVKGDKSSNDKRRHFLLKRPKSIASLQPGMKSSPLF